MTCFSATSLRGSSSRLAGKDLSASYQRRLGRYRYGAGVFKVDYALNAPIPWKAPDCLRAATVHLGGSFEEIAGSEKAVRIGQHRRSSVRSAGPAQSFR